MDAILACWDGQDSGWDLGNTLCLMFLTKNYKDVYTHTRARTIYMSFESGLLMERPPLINASFNDSLLKTGEE